jgi:hypothetical protein
VRVVKDSAFDEVDLSASAQELARLADAVAEGAGFIGAASPRDGNALTGIEVREATGPGVCIALDASRKVLVISGDPAGMGILAGNLRAMAAAEDGGHLHVDYFPGHPYLVEGSLSLVVNSPHGGMPIR